MPFTGGGTYSAPSSPGAFNPALSGGSADPTSWNALLADLSTALSTCITKDGQTTLTANIPMAGFKLTGLGVGTASTDSATLGQVQSGASRYALAAGTADAITLAPSPVITAYAIGQVFTFKATATNTTAMTANVNSVGAGDVKWPNGSALVAGAVVSGGMYQLEVQATTPVFHIQTVSASPLPKSGGTMTGTLTMSGAAINAAKGADIASVAGITDIGAMTGNYGDVTGTNTSTGFGTVQAGTTRTVTFTGIQTLTYNATSLILPGAANIVTAVGDVGTFVSLGSGNWKCTQYQRLSVAPAKGACVGFRAMADGVGSPGALAKMTTAAAAFNAGSYWDNSTKRFTPPVGIYSFQVSLKEAVSNSSIQLFLYKNGAVLGQAYMGDSQTWPQTIGVAMTDQANGTDYYEAYWQGSSLNVPTTTEAWFSAMGMVT